MRVLGPVVVAQPATSSATPTVSIAAKDLNDMTEYLVRISLLVDQ
jgi:hypothetical protein